MRAALPALFLFTAPLLAVDPGLVDLMGPDANFVVGIRVSAIAASPLVQDALAEAQTKNPDLGGVLAALGPNPLAGLEELLLLGRMDAGKDADAEGLLIARGDFSDGRVLQAFCSGGCREETYSGLTLHHAEHEGKPATFVKLDDRYAAAGTVERVKALLHRRATGRKPAISSDLAGWVKDLSQYHLWFAAKGPFEAPPSEAGGPPLGQLAENIQSVGLGMTLGDEVSFGLAVESDTDAHAEELHQMTQGLLMMLSASQSGEDGEPNPAAGLLDKLKIHRESRRLIADLRVPREQLETMVRSGFESEDGEGAETASAPPADAPPTREPAEKPRSNGPIRIYGLGDEPVVVSSGPR
ncbi:MAG: hypothetical protein GC160_23305 [Acidobacteria bacterium]|nr:hypothetical protein [Acidobacteriota bacterium]